MMGEARGPQAKPTTGRHDGKSNSSNVEELILVLFLPTLQLFTILSV